MLVLADPASKVTSIFVNRDKAYKAILTYKFFPIGPLGQSLPFQQTNDGTILIDGLPLDSYLPPQTMADPLVPYIRPVTGFPLPWGVPSAQPGNVAELDYSVMHTGTYLGLVLPGGSQPTGPLRLFLFTPATGRFDTGHYDPSLSTGPCSRPDPQAFTRYEDMQAYAASHGENLLEVQSDQEVQRVCGMTPAELMARYPSMSLSSLVGFLPYIGIGVAALFFLRRRRKG